MAGLQRRRPPMIVDADSLSQAERDELRSLVQAAFAEPRQPDDAGRKAPGSFVITVEEGADERTLSVADMDEERQPAASALRQWLQRRSRVE